MGRLLPVFLPVVLLVATGCEETVDPFIDSDRYFTVYGYLDTGADTQFVRVVPLRRSIESDGAVPIDAQVTTTELETGFTLTWRDSVVAFPGGRFGHVYYAVFHPVPGRTYRLDVARSDGVVSTAETRVPVARQVAIDAPRLLVGATTQRVTWTGVPAHPFNVEVWYRLAPAGAGSPFQDHVFDYPPARAEGSVLAFDVKLSEDADSLRRKLGISDPQVRPQLMGVGVRLSVPDSAWSPPGGVFDPEVLVQPELLANVEHGFGFFGSANRYTVEWVLTPQITQRLGYAYPD